MDPFLAVLLLPILGLAALAFVPSRLANANCRTSRTFVIGMVAIQLGFACVSAFAHALSGGHPVSITLLEWSPGSGVGLGIYFDGATSLMLILVSFVGLIVSRYSVRYLEGEAMQGRYFRWLGFAIGAVSLMVVAGNLLQFFVAWVMTSSGLHQLLLHYRHREAAHRAAWTKFTISRLGDAFLIAALMMTFKSFGTFELATLFASASDLATNSQATSSHVAIGWLLVMGAVTKSAQFPFHTWLPDTMETPTPVSALMHAGIVNAGGYLIIRMSPLVALAPAALHTLAVIGAFTACFAGAIMMTQSSVKRSLAYSTVAQMGFMMLQCGLGAFSLAMLHILAHSLYKAHAFLSSGSVLSHIPMTGDASSPRRMAPSSIAMLFASGAASLLAFFMISRAIGVDVTAKQGGVILAFILCLALTTWGWNVFTLGGRGALFGGTAALLTLCSIYLSGYLLVHHLMQPALGAVAINPTSPWVLVATALLFCILFAMHVCLVHRRLPRWLAPMYVHAANGFYVDAIYRRLFSSLARS